MSQVNVIPQDLVVKKNHSLISLLPTESISLTKPKYVELWRKLTYTLINLVSRPKYFLVFIFARFRKIRQVYLFLTRLLSNSTLTTNYRAISLFEELDTAKALDNLRQDAVYQGITLPPDFLSDLLQYLKNQDCYAGGRSNMGFRIADKQQLDRICEQPFYVARYFNLSEQCPQIKQLADDPKLRNIANNYIGKPAKYTGASLFWTFPIDGISSDADQQKFRYFHYDIDDFAGLRFCFYLTDVTMKDGPHVYIRGSHVKKQISHLLNYISRIQTKAELTKFYGSEQFSTITGEAGTGFVEDTFCFHKGAPPESKPRLFLQLHFAANNYGRSPYLDNRDSNTLKSLNLSKQSEIFR